MQATIQRSFGGGEIAPALAARADIVKYTAGLRTCRNFVVRKEGGVSNRAGFRFIEACKDATDDHWLLRFDSSEEGDALLIEAGNGYLRFFKGGDQVLVSAVPAYNGATPYSPGAIVLSGGVNYYCIKTTTGNAPPNVTFWYAMPTGNILEIPHPFGAHQFNWVQSGTVITLTHADVAPQELVFLGLTTWVMRPVVTTPIIDPPSAVGATPGVVGTRTFRYVVTSAAVDTYEESNPSAVATAVSGDPTAAAPTVISWALPAQAAAEFYVYLDPYGNGTYGFIGTATGSGVTSFKDIGFVPDFSVTPPIPRVLFAATNDYPHVAAYYQQRRFFAHTNNVPDGIWASRPGFHSNFGVSSPLQDDDALTFKISGNKQNPVRAMLGLKSLITLTGAGEWSVGEPKIPLTPNNIPTDQQTYLGAHDKKPVAIGNGIVYIQARGSLVNYIQFEQQVEGLAGKDLTVFASHLFEGFTLNRVDYQQTPLTTVWAPRGDGTLLGLTYIPEQDLWGWHRHDTGASGVFEDVCVVPEAGEDVLYVIVHRVINGADVRYIERLESRNIVDWDEDVFFVDAGLSYSGAAANHFTGLDHLEGEIVAVVGDGAVVFNGDPTAANAATFKVTGGAITTAAEYEVVHIGIPIRYPEIETLDLDVAGGSVRDKVKRLGSLNILLDGSSLSFLAGEDEAHLRQFVRQAWEGTADSNSGQYTLNLTSSFNQNGRVLIRQTDPLPLTILGVLPQFDLGG